MKRLSQNITVFLSFFILMAQPAAGAERLTLFVSVVSQKFFVQQIGKDLVDVHVMVQPGASPATYEPKPRQMADISKAKIYFAVGVPFEKTWLEKIVAANTNMKVIHTDQGIEKIPMASGHHHAKGAGKNRGNPHIDERGEPDPHIWLSPPLVKIQARTILNALQEADPSHMAAYEGNYDRFMSAIDDLHNHLGSLFSDKKGLRFMVFHPAWGYFAHTYGLKEIPVEIEGKSPKPAALKALIETARKDNIKLIFVQPQFSMKSAELIAREIGGRVAVADPLAEDWMTNIRRVADKLTTALK